MKKSDLIQKYKPKKAACAQKALLLHKGILFSYLFLHMWQFCKG